MFPKKGKPKAAGSANILNEISPSGAENVNIIEDDENIEENNNDLDKLNQEAEMQLEDIQSSNEKESSALVE